MPVRYWWISAITTESKFEEWLTFDDSINKELCFISDETEIQDRFYKDLEFGTGGLRGVMGAGSNRINSYTIKKASKGLANYILAKNNNENSIVIAYDTRNNSSKYAENAAEMFSSMGIKVFMFSNAMPTPVLSFAVRHLKCQSGIVITASHNPKEYNGFKVYNSKGGQVTPDDANEIMNKISVINDLKSLNKHTANHQLITHIGDEVLDIFLNEVNKQSIFNGKLNVVYTPIHGAGYVPVSKALSKYDLTIVESQKLPNGEFPTVKSPNPEDKRALSKGIEEAKKRNADIVLGTDPDCDRVGVAIRHNEDYEMLTGNQIGALLVDFVVSNKKITNKNVLLKTIVTNDLGAKIAQIKGALIEETLTGFKYIGEKINEYEENKTRDFLIGYEESYGYLIGNHARDKDGVVSSLLICEMAAYYKERNLTLLDRLMELFKEFGYYLDVLDSITLEGIEGSEKINSVMNIARKTGELLLETTVKVEDFLLGVNGLPKENVLKFTLKDGSWVAIRPSGTEPKIKFYYSINANNKSNAVLNLQNIKNQLTKKLNINLL